MSSIAEIMSKQCNLREEVVSNFNDSLKTNLFADLAETASVELVSAHTTFSYLNMRYIIRDTALPNKVLSIIIHGSKNCDDTSIRTRYLSTDFAILNHDLSKNLSGVRVFGGEFSYFKTMLYKHIIPLLK